MGQFVRVAAVGELKPGEMRQVVVGDQRILLANVDGTYYALNDDCTHLGASLSDGTLSGEIVECPLHGSQFNVRSGEVVEWPADEAAQTYEVRVEEDQILLGLP